ncbi:MAG: hypothetical protein U9Q98_04490 [Bacteroidota bacterium]|nr:hypothetical protein [Bacteroidota bacterium]
MDTVILNNDSKSDLKLLINLAKKLGIKAKFLNEEGKEDIGILNAIKQGRTGEYVNTDNFVKKLRK